MKKKLTDKQVEKILKKNLKIYNKNYKNNLNITNKRIPKDYYGFDFTVYLKDGKISNHQTVKRVESKYFGTNNKEYLKAKKKTGLLNLKRKINKFHLTQEKLNKGEKKRIRITNSQDKRVGYNNKEGGSHGKHHEDTKLYLKIKAIKREKTAEGQIARRKTVIKGQKSLRKRIRKYGLTEKEKLKGEKLKITLNSTKGRLIKQEAQKKRIKTITNPSYRKAHKESYKRRGRKISKIRNNKDWKNKFQDVFQKASKKTGKTLRKKYKSGEIIHPFLNKHHKKNTKIKMSDRKSIPILCYHKKTRNKLYFKNIKKCAKYFKISGIAVQRKIKDNRKLGVRNEKLSILNEYQIKFVKKNSKYIFMN